MNRTRSLPLFALWPLPAAAAAHAPGVEVKLVGATVRVEAFFDDNTPAAAAKVTVTDEAGTEVAAGVTDSAGLWTFPTPPPGEYRIRMDAGVGHVARRKFTVPDAATEGATISDGPTRDEATGPWRWAKAAAGLLIIAVIALIARRWLRR